MGWLITGIVMLVIGALSSLVSARLLQQKKSAGGDVEDVAVPSAKTTGLIPCCVGMVVQEGGNCLAWGTKWFEYKKKKGHVYYHAQALYGIGKPAGDYHSYLEAVIFAKKGYWVWRLDRSKSLVDDTYRNNWCTRSLSNCFGGYDGNGGGIRAQFAIHDGYRGGWWTTIHYPVPAEWKWPWSIERGKWGVPYMNDVENFGIFTFFFHGTGDTSGAAASGNPDGSSAWQTRDLPNENSDNVPVFGSSPNFPAMAFVWQNHLWGEPADHLGDPMIPFPGQRPYGINTDWQGQNPIHIIWWLLRKRAQVPIEVLDVESFRKAADICRYEGFGLSYVWSAEASVEDIVKDVLDTIYGWLATDAQTGKLYIRLGRADYKASDLPLFDETMISELSLTRTQIDDLSNQITIKYNDAYNYGTEAVVTQQNQVMFDIQGGPIGSEKSFKGIWIHWLAEVVAARELKLSSTPLLAVQFKCDVSFSGLRIGDCIRVSAPTQFVKSVVVRITQIEIPPITESDMTVIGVEDVFGYGEEIHALPDQPPRKPETLGPGVWIEQVILELPKELEPSVASVELMCYVSVPEEINKYTTQYSYSEQGSDSVVNTVFSAKQLPLAELHSLPLALSASTAAVYYTFAPEDAVNTDIFQGYYRLKDGDLTEWVYLSQSDDSGLAWEIRRAQLRTSANHWPQGSLMFRAGAGFRQPLAQYLNNGEISVPYTTFNTNTSAPIVANGVATAPFTHAYSQPLPNSFLNLTFMVQKAGGAGLVPFPVPFDGSAIHMTGVFTGGTVTAFSLVWDKVVPLSGGANTVKVYMNNDIGGKVKFTNAAAVELNIPDQTWTTIPVVENPANNSQYCIRGNIYDRNRPCLVGIEFSDNEVVRHRTMLIFTCESFTDNGWGKLYGLLPNDLKGT